MTDVNAVTQCYEDAKRILPTLLAPVALVVETIDATRLAEPVVSFIYTKG